MGLVGTLQALSVLCFTLRSVARIGVLTCGSLPNSDPRRVPTLAVMSTPITPRNPVHVPDAATIAGCSERHVWALLARGDLRRWKAGHRTVVDADELVELLAPRAA